MLKKILPKLDTVGLVLLVGAAIWYSAENAWNKWIVAVAVAGALCIVAGIAANYRQIMTTLGKRSTKYATNYAVSVILVVALVSGVNFMGQRYSKRIDLTGSGTHTLAEQTVQVLDKLQSDVDIKAFFPGGDYPRLRDLLVNYRARNRRVKYEFIDPDKHPEYAKQYDVTVYGTFSNPFTGTQMKSGTVVLVSGDRREKVEKRSDEVREEDLTNALIKLGRKEQKKVYFVQGHGEKDPANTERTGYSEAKKGLEDQGIKVETANLASDAKVPDDAKVVVLAGPTTEPFAAELQYLTDFMNKGGGVLAMIDPQAPALEGFLKAWSVTPDNDVLLDVSGAGRLLGAGPQIPLVMQYESHKITERFRSMTFFPYARSVQPSKETVSGVNVEAILKTTQRSWGETELKNPEASFDEKKDLQGPLPIAVAVTKEVKPGPPAVLARMVVVGDSDFAVNAYFKAQGNGNLFLNMVSWLAQEEDLISIRPKPPEDRRIILSRSQQTRLLYLTVFILPAAVLIAGITVWQRRRR